MNIKLFAGPALLSGILSLAITAASPAQCQEARLSPNAPQDKPVKIDSQDSHKRLEEAIAPYVKKALETLPDAKKRFLAGLPEGDIFFVTTRLYENKSEEQIFVRVKSWKDSKITGTISSKLMLIKKFNAGDRIDLDESKVLDWLIAKPDGSEEGNFVGKFLDTYNPKDGADGAAGAEGADSVKSAAQDGAGAEKQDKVEKSESVSSKDSAPPDSDSSESKAK